MSDVLCTALSLLVLLILASIVLSWFPMAPGSTLASIYSVLYRITEPLLGPIRRAIPPVRIGGIALDLSAIIVLFAIQILRPFVC